MKVSELIEKLKTENQNLHVYIQGFDSEWPEFKLCENVSSEDLQDFDDDGNDLPCIVIR